MARRQARSSQSKQTKQSSPVRAERATGRYTVAEKEEILKQVHAHSNNPQARAPPPRAALRTGCSRRSPRRGRASGGGTRARRWRWSPFRREVVGFCM